MIEFIIQWDYAAFEWVHHSTENGLFDLVMPILRNKYVWIPLYVFLIAFFIINFGKRAVVYVLFIIATAGIADYTSSSIVKPAVERERPCKNVKLFRFTDTLVDCGSGYSFTSSHATNHMAVAVFIILTTASLWKRHRWWFFLWALMISYEQVYVGVHYPLDVLAGSLLGALVAGIVYSLYIKLFPNMYYGSNYSR